jgi:hypothetical protein
MNEAPRNLGGNRGRDSRAPAHGRRPGVECSSSESGDRRSR